MKPIRGRRMICFILAKRRKETGELGPGGQIYVTWADGHTRFLGAALSLFCMGLLSLTIKIFRCKHGPCPQLTVLWEEHMRNQDLAEW